MYQAEPARSDLSTKRSQRGIDEAAGLTVVHRGALLRLIISTVRRPARECNYLTGSRSNWYDHLTSGH